MKKWWHKLASLGTRLRCQEKRAARQPQRSVRLCVEPLEERILFAQRIWDGAAGTGLWSTAGNWVGNVAPLAGDDLIFPQLSSTGTLTNDFAAGTVFNTITLGGSGYTLNGNAIQLNGGLTANNTSGSNTFSLNSTLVNALSIVSANAGTTLNITGTLDTAGLVGTSQFFGTSALTVDGSGTTNDSGKITGSGSLSKLGSGMLILSGPNDYEGITDVRQGIVQIASATALGSATTGDTQVQAGACLQVTGGITVAEPLAIREEGVGFGNGTDPSTLGSLRSVGGNNTWTGGIELAGTNNTIGVDAGSVLNISGVVSGLTSAGRALYKAGAGELQLTGTQANVYTGATNVLQGTLSLGKTAGVNAIGGDLIVGNNIGGAASATVKLLADNQLPDLNYFSVALTNLTVNSGGLLNFNGHTDTVGNVTLVEGQTYSAVINLNGGTMILGGASLTLNAFQGSSGVSPAAVISNGTFDLGTFFSGAGGGATKTFTINDSQLNNVAADLDISANITGIATTSLTKVGGGTLQLDGTNTYAGPTILNGGLVAVNTDAAFGTGLVAIPGVTLVGVGGTHTINNLISLDGTLNTLGTNLVFAGAATLTGGRTIQVMNPNQTVTFSGGIGEGIFGSQNLNKSGRGTLVLSGTNTYSGATTVNDDGGMFMLSGNGTLLDTNGLTVGQGSTFVLDNSGSANLTDRLNDLTAIALNNGTFLFIGSSTGSTETLGVVTLGGSEESNIESANNGGTTVLTIDALGQTNNGTVNFIGINVALSATGANRISIINDPGGITNGILPWAVVSGPAGHDFATYQSSPEGVAVVALPSADYITNISQATATSNLLITANTTLTGPLTVNALFLAPGVTLNDGGASALTVTSGLIVFGGSGAIKVAALNSQNIGLYFVANGGTATINSVISNDFGASGNNRQILKAGSGTLILTGNNTFGGNTFVNEGVLNIQNSNALGGPISGTSVRANAALQLQQTSFGAVNISTEALTLEGTGGPGDPGALQNLGGNNSWAGTVSLAGNATNLLTVLGGFPVIANGTTVFDVAANSMLTLTGAVVNNVDVALEGGGTLQYAGILGNTYNANTRVLAGTLMFNKSPGLNSVNSTIFVGTDVAGAPAAALTDLANDQIPDGVTVQVNSSGTFNVGTNTSTVSEAIGALNLVIGPTAGTVAIGPTSTLTINGNLTVLTQGTNNPLGASISGGTLALTLFGTGSNTRVYQVNPGTSSIDLDISSTIVDGSGLANMSLTKSGLGTMRIDGTGGNTFSGTTLVDQGTLLLSETGGNAIGGALTVGTADANFGFANSRVARWLKSNQIPDLVAPVTVNSTGLMDLNGFSDTIGNVDAQTGLTLNQGTVSLGGGTLTLNGNITNTLAQGVNLFTPVFASQITGGTLNIGSLVRNVDPGGDRSELPYELLISSSIVGTGGINLTNSGTLLLTGNNTYSGGTFRSNGNFAVGSDTAFGTGPVYFGTGNLLTYNGPRKLANDFYFGGNQINFLAGNNVGGGGNNLTFTGNVILTGGTTTINVIVAGIVEFAGGVGESFGGSALNKIGFGTLVISGNSPYSGGSTIGTNGGDFVIRGQGAVLNSNFAVNVGGVLEIDDNTGGNLTSRIGDLATITLAGGTLAFVGADGAVSTEAVGQITLNNNFSNVIQSIVDPTVAGSAAEWRIATISRTANQGSTLQFIARGTDIGSATTNRINITTAPAQTNGIIPFATILNSTGLEFATAVNPSGAPTTTNYITPLTSFKTDLTTAGATDNVKVSASVAIGTITANALLIVSNGVSVSGTSLTLGSGLLGNIGTGTNISVNTLTLGGTEGLITNYGASSMTITGVVAGAGTDLGVGGTGTLNMQDAGNTYAGATFVTQGTFVAATNTAFGPNTATGVTVSYGGTVALTNNITIPAKTLTLNGNGESTTGAVPLMNLSGTNTWLGNVNLASNLATNRTGIFVAAGSSLILETGTANVVSNLGFNKFGDGDLQFAGSASNTFTQTSIVWRGTLELNKTGGASAIPATLAANSTFFIGDLTNPTVKPTVRLLGSNEIAAGPFLTRVMPSGLLDLNGFNDTLQGPNVAGQNINALELDIDAESSGQVTTGAGILTLGNATAGFGGLAVGVFSGGTPAPATISGNLAIATGGAAAIATGDSAAIEDLQISAALTGAQAITLSGSGRTVLSGNNTAYTGAITVGAGELVARNANNPLGTGSVTVNSGFSLLLDNVGTIGNALILNNTGFGAQGALHNVNGNNAVTGIVTLTTNSATISVNAGQTLDLQNQITGAVGLTKLMPGTLQFSGNTANNYTGVTTVNEGTLNLNKAAGVAAIAGNLTIGNDAGDATHLDVVRDLAGGQIAAGVAITIQSTGLLDLNGFNETLSLAAAGTALRLRDAVTFSAQVQTGAGTLTLGANANLVAESFNPTSNPQPPFTTQSPGAIIGGKLSLGGTAHVFQIGNDPSIVGVQGTNSVGLNIHPLEIDATIDNSGGGTITRGTGTSILYLNANNSATLTNFTLNDGAWAIGQANALGSGTVTVAATVSVAPTLFAANFGTGTPIVLPNNITLNGNVSVRGDRNFTFAGVVTQSLAVTVTENMNAGAVADFAGGLNLGGAFTLTLTNNTFGGTDSVSGLIADGAASGNITKNGSAGGVFVFGHANTFTGNVTVAAGALRITNSNALSATGTTTVNAGATLQVVGGLTVPETLVLNGNGVGNYGALRMLDSTPGVAETTMWTGNITLNATSFIRVDGGGNNADTLDLGGGTAAIISGGGGLTKTGPGIVAITGTVSNTYTNTTTVNEGTLKLAKALGFVATGTGTLVVGDEGGGAGADRAILVNNNQVNNNANITVASSGLLDLASNNASQGVVGTLTLEVGPTTSATVNTGAGTLTTNAVTVNATGGAIGFTDSTAPAATISGNLNLNGGARNFTINTTLLPSTADMLVIPAVISNGGITKVAGTGTLALTGANTYATATTLNAGSGMLVVRGGGSITSTASVTINNGDTLLLDNTASSTNRLGAAVAVTMTGGTLSFIGNAAGTTQQVGALTLNAGTSFVNTIQSTTNGGNLAALVFSSLTRNAGAVLSLIGVGADLGSATNQVVVTGAVVGGVNGIFPWATVSGPAGLDLVQNVSGGPQTSFGRVTSYSNNINSALGANVRLDGTEPAANRSLTGNSNINALLIVGSGITINTQGFSLNNLTGQIVTAGSATILGGGTIAYASQEPLFFVEPGSSLTVSTNITGSANLREEGGGTLVLNADNTAGAGFTGTITVDQGILQVQNGNALGATTAGTTVNSGAQLQLSGSLVIGNEALTLNGTGFNNDGTGALRDVSGSTTWGTGTTAINYATASNVGVDNAADTLTFNATVTHTAALTKVGAGTLAYSGTAANGGGGAITVNAGTLALAKTAAVQATGTGALIIGDNDGGANADNVIVQNNPNQIAGVAVTVNRSGKLNLNGLANAAAFTSLTINGGTFVTGGASTANSLTVSGGTINTGAASLVLNGNLTYNSGPQTIIAGTLDLGTGTRTITVNDGPALNDLEIDAQIINGRILKNGGGTLLLTNAGNSLSDVSAVQTITFAGGPVVGTTQFNLSFNGFIGANITYDGNPATIQTYLQSFPTIGAGNVTVAGGPLVFTVTFTGQLAGVSVGAIGGAIIAPGPGTIAFAAPTAGASGVNLNAGVLALTNPGAIGGGSLDISSTGTLRAEGGNLTGATAVSNRVTFLNAANNTVFTLGGRNDVNNTFGVELSGSVLLPMPGALGTQLFLNVDDPAVMAKISGAISAGNGNLILRKGINGGANPGSSAGTLVLSGNNTFQVEPAVPGTSPNTGQQAGISIDAGILSVANSNAFGSTPLVNVNVRGDLQAALQLDGSTGPVNLPSSVNLILFFPNGGSATGYLNNFTGLLSSVGTPATTNSVAGIIDTRNINGAAGAGTVYIGVAGTNVLNLQGAILGSFNAAGTPTDTNHNLIKVGAGTLTYSGSEGNQITGTTTILSGTLDLKKNPGVSAILGPLVVGDNVGGPNADKLQLDSSEQINVASAVTVNTTGQIVTTAAQAASVSNEVQTVTVTATAGQFRLTFNGSQTGDLAFNASSATVEAALNALPTIGGVGGAVAVVLTGGVYTVAFEGSLAGANQPQMTVQPGTTAFSGGTVTPATLTDGGLLGQESIGALTLVAGSAASGNVSLNAGSTLALTNNVAVNIFPGATAATPSAQISGGNLALLPEGATAAATRTFTVNDGPNANDLVITSNILDGAAGLAGALTKAGAGRMVLNPTGTSTFSGVTTVNAGVVQVQQPTALGAGGAATNNTVVAAGAALEAAGVSVPNELLTLNGTGIINGPITVQQTSILGTGALINLSGTTTWGGAITLNTNPVAVAVNAGQLNLTGVVSGANGLTEVGPGTLQLGGAASNTYTGNTFVNQGTLLLNGAAGTQAIAGGTLFVGDDIGGSQADVVRFAAGSGTTQLNNIPIVVNSSGLLDLNGVSETNNNTLVLGIGPAGSGTVTTGAGTLTINNNVTVISQPGVVSSTTGASIQGNLNLSAASRTFTVNASGALIDLDVPAIISNGGVTKAGRGTMQIEGNNTYIGTTIMNADSGLLVVNTPNTVAASAYTINPGSTLTGNGFIRSSLTLAAQGSNLPTGGIVNPGSATPGTTAILTVNSVVFNAGSVFYADINGTTAGTQYDQLAVTSGAVLITGGVGGAMLTGNTSFSPVNGVDTFTLINKTSAGLITGNFTNAVPPSPPNTVNVGTKSYTFSYTAINGHDFVLGASVGTRVWVGLGLNNNWTLGANWQGGAAPMAGDNLIFNDIGVGNRNMPLDDFAAGTMFGSVTFNTTLGSYTVTGNGITLATAGSLITNTAGTNTFNVPVVFTAGPQTITATAGSLTLGTINGAVALTTAGGGNVTFGGAVGTTTPLTSLTTSATGTTGLAASSLISSGAQVYNDPVLVTGATALTASIITFNSTVDGPQGLSVTSTGATTFNAAIGSTTPLGALTTGATGTTVFNTGTITTSGAQSYNDPVTLAGNTTFTAGSITVNTSVTGPGNQTYTTVDQATPGQDIIVTGTASLHSTGGAITLQAGDNINIQTGAVIQAANAVTLLVDFADADPGVGASLTMNAAVTGTALNMAGGNDSDTFNVALGPSPTIPFTINGNLPVLPTMPGDVLNVDLTGVGNPFVVQTSPGNGMITSSDHQTLNYISIETLTVSGNSATNPIISVPTTGGADTVRVVRNGIFLQIFVNGVLVYSQPYASVQTITINGSSDNTTMIVDNSGGVISRPISFNGGTGTNTLQVVPSGSQFATEVNTTTGPNAGVLLFDPDGIPNNGDEETIHFSAVQSVQDTQVVTTLNMQASAGSDVISVIDGPIVNGLQTTEVVSNGTFATYLFADKANVNVDGMGGSDTFALNNPNPAAGLVTLSLYGNAPGAPVGAVPDSFIVYGTAASVDTSVIAQDSGDGVTVSDFTGTLNSVRGPLNITSQPGDLVTLNDQGSTAGNAYVITATTIFRSGVAPITYGPGGTTQILAGSGNDAFTVLGTGGALLLNTGGGTNSINIGAGQTGNVVNAVTVNSSAGVGDQLLVDDSLNTATADRVTVTPTAVGATPGDTIFGPGGGLIYTGVPSLTVNTSNSPTGDFIDVFPSTTTAVTINAGAPVPPTQSGDTLHVEFAGVTGPHLSISSPGNGQWTFTNRMPVTFTSVENLNHTAIIPVGPDAGSPPTVNVFNADDGSLKLTLTPFPSFFAGGVRVAAADVTGDGVPDIIVAAGPGGSPQLRVYDGLTGQPLPGLLGSFFAMPAIFTGGVFVAAGDINGDGHADIVVGADAGGGPEVQVFSGADGSLLRSFYGLAPSFTGGVRVAVADVNGDGFGDIICAAGPGGGPQVTVYSGKDGSILQSFYAYPAFFTNGVYVGAGDINGDGLADIITGPGTGGSPEVKVFGGMTSKLLQDFFAYPLVLNSQLAEVPTSGAFRSGVRVAALDVNGDGRAEIITGAGPVAPPEVKVFDALSLAVLDDFFAYSALFRNGIYVGN